MVIVSGTPPDSVIVCRYADVAFWTSWSNDTSILREASRLCFVGGGRGRSQE